MQVSPLVSTRVNDLNAVHGRPIIDKDFIVVPLVSVNESRIILDDKSRQFIAFNGSDKGWIVFIAHQCSYIVHHRVYDNLISTNNKMYCSQNYSLLKDCSGPKKAY